MTMPRSEDWKIGVRRMLESDPEFRIEMEKDISELLSTGDAGDRRVAYRMARGLLELEFDSDAELLALLRETVPA